MDSQKINTMHGNLLSSLCKEMETKETQQSIENFMESIEISFLDKINALEIKDVTSFIGFSVEALREMNSALPKITSQETKALLLKNQKKALLILYRLTFFFEKAFIQHQTLPTILSFLIKTSTESNGFLGLKLLFEVVRVQKRGFELFLPLLQEIILDSIPFLQSSTDEKPKAAYHIKRPKVLMEAIAYIIVFISQENNLKDDKVIIIYLLELLKFERKRETVECQTKAIFLLSLLLKEKFMEKEIPKLVDTAFRMLIEAVDEPSGNKKEVTLAIRNMLGSPRIREEIKKQKMKIVDYCFSSASGNLSSILFREHLIGLGIDICSLFIDSLTAEEASSVFRRIFFFLREPQTIPFIRALCIKLMCQIIRETSFGKENSFELGVCLLLSFSWCLKDVVRKRLPQKGLMQIYSEMSKNAKEILFFIQKTWKEVVRLLLFYKANAPSKEESLAFVFSGILRRVLTVLQRFFVLYKTEKEDHRWFETIEESIVDLILNTIRIFNTKSIRFILSKAAGVIIRLCKENGVFFKIIEIWVERGRNLQELVECFMEHILRKLNSKKKREFCDVELNVLKVFFSLAVKGGALEEYVSKKLLLLLDNYVYSRKERRDYIHLFIFIFEKVSVASTKIRDALGKYRKRLLERQRRCLVDGESHVTADELKGTVLLVMNVLDVSLPESQRHMKIGLMGLHAGLKYGLIEITKAAEISKEILSSKHRKLFLTWNKGSLKRIFVSLLYAEDRAVSYSISNLLVDILPEKEIIEDTRGFLGQKRFLEGERFDVSRIMEKVVKKYLDNRRMSYPERKALFDLLKERILQLTKKEMKPDVEGLAEKEDFRLFCLEEIALKNGPAWMPEDAIKCFFINTKIKVINQEATGILLSVYNIYFKNMCYDTLAMDPYTLSSKYARCFFLKELSEAMGLRECKVVVEPFISAFIQENGKFLCKTPFLSVLLFHLSFEITKDDFSTKVFWLKKILDVYYSNEDYNRVVLNLFKAFSLQKKIKYLKILSYLQAKNNIGYEAILHEYSNEKEDPFVFFALTFILERKTTLDVFLSKNDPEILFQQENIKVLSFLLFKLDPKFPCNQLRKNIQERIIHFKEEKIKKHHLMFLKWSTYYTIQGFCVFDVLISILEKEIRVKKVLGFLDAMEEKHVMKYSDRLKSLLCAESAVIRLGVAKVVSKHKLECFASFVFDKLKETADSICDYAFYVDILFILCKEMKSKKYIFMLLGEIENYETIRKGFLSYMKKNRGILSIKTLKNEKMFLLDLFEQNLTKREFLAEKEISETLMFSLINGKQAQKLIGGVQDVFFLRVFFPELDNVFSKHKKQYNLLLTVVRKVFFTPSLAQTIIPHLKKLVLNEEVKIVTWVLTSMSKKGDWKETIRDIIYHCRWRENTGIFHFLLALTEKNKMEKEFALILKEGASVCNILKDYISVKKDGRELGFIWKPCLNCCLFHPKDMACSSSGFETIEGLFSNEEMNIYSIHKQTYLIKCKKETRQATIENIRKYLQMKPSNSFLASVLTAAVFKMTMNDVFNNQEESEMTECLLHEAIETFRENGILFRPSYFQQFMLQNGNRADDLFLFAAILERAYERRDHMLDIELKEVVRFFFLPTVKKDVSFVLTTRKVLGLIAQENRQAFEEIARLFIPKKDFYSLAIIYTLAVKKGNMEIKGNFSSILTGFLDEGNELVPEKYDNVLSEFFETVVSLSNNPKELVEAFVRGVLESHGIARAMFPFFKQSIAKKMFSEKEEDELIQAYSIHARGNAPFLNDYFDIILSIYKNKECENRKIRSLFESIFKEKLLDFRSKKRHDFYAVYESSLVSEPLSRLIQIIGKGAWKNTGRAFVLTTCQLLLDTIKNKSTFWDKLSSVLQKTHGEVLKETVISLLFVFFDAAKKKEKRAFFDALSSFIMQKRSVKDGSFDFLNILQVFFFREKIKTPDIVSFNGDPFFRVTHGEYHLQNKKKLTEAYEQIYEESYVLGSIHTTSLLPETKKGAMLELFNECHKAQNFYEQAQSFSKDEMFFCQNDEYAKWEDRWLFCAKKMQQWDILKEVLYEDKDQELFLYSCFMTQFLEMGRGYEEERGLYKERKPIKTRNAFEEIIKNTECLNLRIVYSSSAGIFSKFVEECNELQVILCEGWKRQGTTKSCFNQMLLQNIKMLSKANEINNCLKKESRDIGKIIQRLKKEKHGAGDLSSSFVSVFFRENLLKLIKKEAKAEKEKKQCEAEIRRGRERFPVFLRRERLFGAALHFLAQNVDNVYLRIKDQARILTEINSASSLAIIENVNFIQFSKKKQSRLKTILGKIYLDVSDEKAEDVFFEALKLEKNNREVFEQLGMLYVKKFKKEGDFKYLEAAVEFFSENVFLSKRETSVLMEIVVFICKYKELSKSTNLLRKILRIPLKLWSSFITPLINSPNKITKKILEEMANEEPLCLFYEGREFDARGKAAKKHPALFSKYKNLVSILESIVLTNEEKVYNKILECLFSLYSIRKKDILIGGLEVTIKKVPGFKKETGWDWKKISVGDAIRGLLSWKRRLETEILQMHSNVFKEEIHALRIQTRGGKEIEVLNVKQKREKVGEYFIRRVVLVLENGKSEEYALGEIETQMQFNMEYNISLLFERANCFIAKSRLYKKDMPIFQLPKKTRIGAGMYIQKIGKEQIALSEVFGTVECEEMAARSLEIEKAIEKAEPRLLKRLMKNMESPCDYWVFKKGFCSEYTALCFCSFICGMGLQHPSRIIFNSTGSVSYSKFEISKSQHFFRLSNGIQKIIGECGFISSFVPKFTHLLELFSTLLWDEMFFVFTKKELENEVKERIKGKGRRFVLEILDIEKNIFYLADYPAYFYPWL
eukprot:GHVN01098468.1.p1 GENE.GHVN01098468.1~~GHVN01098468.1.p1  ORF type:complete len:2839 (+),score=238.65 GHVN01098468.1:255-8771(+)